MRAQRQKHTTREEEGTVLKDPLKHEPLRGTKLLMAIDLFINRNRSVNPDINEKIYKRETRVREKGKVGRIAISILN